MTQQSVWPIGKYAPHNKQDPAETRNYDIMHGASFGNSCIEQPNYIQAALAVSRAREKHGLRSQIQIHGPSKPCYKPICLPHRTGQSNLAALYVLLSSSLTTIVTETADRLKVVWVVVWSTSFGRAAWRWILWNRNNKNEGVEEPVATSESCDNQHFHMSKGFVLLAERLNTTQRGKNPAGMPSHTDVAPYVQCIHDRKNTNVGRHFNLCGPTGT